MLKNVFTLLLAVALVAASAGCSKKKTAAELQAEKEKTWRVEQMKRAQQYYKKLADTYPDSEYAAKAKERLAVIGTPAAAKPGASTTAKK